MRVGEHLFAPSDQLLLPGSEALMQWQKELEKSAWKISLEVEIAWSGINLKSAQASFWRCHRFS